MRLADICQNDHESINSNASEVLETTNFALITLTLLN